MKDKELLKKIKEKPIEKIKRIEKEKADEIREFEKYMDTSLKIKRIPLWLVEEIQTIAKKKYSNDYGILIGRWYEIVQEHERMMNLLSAISEDYLIMKEMLFSLPCVNEKGEIQECYEEKDPEDKREKKINLLSGGDLKKD